MESPEPVRAHRKLEKLAGHFSGPERMHPSYFNDTNVKAEAVTDAQVALDGFAVVQDYAQQQDDGTRFAGHGVFRYDMPSDTYELHWFDSTGGPERIFRGGFEGRLLVLTARTGAGWQRLTYDFNLERGYRFKLETSEDGQQWNLALEGENFESSPQRRKTDRSRDAARKSAAARKAAPKKAAGRKKTAKRATAKKAGAKKASAKKAGAKKASAKKAGAKKASAKKASAKKASAKKASAKKAGAKKAGAGKAGVKKTTAKKAAPKKAAAKKTAAGKATARKTAAKKATAKKATGKKAATKKATARKAGAKKTAAAGGARSRVSKLERDRRSGRASKKLSTRKGDSHRPEDQAAPPTKISQQKRKAGAQYGPRMPNLKKTSTRVGWRKTAAKGKPEN